MEQNDTCEEKQCEMFLADFVAMLAENLKINVFCCKLEPIKITCPERILLKSKKDLAVLLVNTLKDNGYLLICIEPKDSPSYYKIIKKTS